MKILEQWSVAGPAQWRRIPCRESPINRSFGQLQLGQDFLSKGIGLLAQKYPYSAKES